MALIRKDELIWQLSPPLDSELIGRLIDEFISTEKRFVLRDWEPTQLDGGQFCELLSQIIYHQDSGNLNKSKDLDDCLKYIDNEQVPHALARQDAKYLSRVLRVVYKFRSNRGAVHISATYKPSHMDSKLVVENVRWLFAETLRLFWNSDREKVAKAVREILQFDIPAIGKFDDELLVQRVDLDAEQEILLLLHYAGEEGFTRTQIGRFARRTPPTITRALQSLIHSNSRQVILLGNPPRYRLTDLGTQRVNTQLATKLTI
jgi:hypothetical protein